MKSVLDEFGVPDSTDLEPILGIPEYETPLPGGSRPSHTDVLVLARGSRGLVVIAVEAKVDESFGDVISDWGPDGSPGRRTRFDYLCEVVGLDPGIALDLRYQLLHRTAASIIEGERFGAAASLMLVHSFSPDHAGVRRLRGVRVGIRR